MWWNIIWSIINKSSLNCIYNSRLEQVVGGGSEAEINFLHSSPEPKQFIITHSHQLQQMTISISALDSGRRRYKATSFHTNTIYTSQCILMSCHFWTPSIHHTNILNCSCHWFLLLFVDCPHHHVQNNKIFTGINILYLSAYKKSGSEPQREDKESLRSACWLVAGGGVLTYAKLGSIYSFSIYSRLHFQYFTRYPFNSSEYLRFLFFI